MSTTSNPNINNISDVSSVSSSQVPSTTQVLTTTPTPIPTREVVFYTNPPEESTDPTNPPIPSFENSLTSNIVTTSCYGSVILYFRPEYESTYSTKFIATLSDSNYIKFNDYNSNVDVYKEGSNKVSFNILSKTNPAYIGLDFCSYKNNKITDSDSAYEIGAVTIENENNEWFKYEYSNNSTSESGSTEVKIRFGKDEYFDTSSYKTAPKINISYTYQTFTSYIKPGTVNGNIQINLSSPSTKPDKPNYTYQNIEINAELNVPFGLSKDLFKDDGKYVFARIKDENTNNIINKYDQLKKFFRYKKNNTNSNDFEQLPADYNDFINTPIKRLFLVNDTYPTNNISITLEPYTYYTYGYPNTTVISSYTITINVQGSGIEQPTEQPTPTTKAPNTAGPASPTPT